MLLDVRRALGDDRGRERYLERHLPGAVFVDLDAEFADPPPRRAGRPAVPSVQRLQSLARRWNIHAGDRVVVHDDSGGLAAARAWWLLRRGGPADVRLLDGGLTAWCAAGGPMETGHVVPQPGDVTLTASGMPTLTAGEAAVLPARSAPGDGEPRPRRHVRCGRRTHRAVRRARGGPRRRGGRPTRNGRSPSAVIPAPAPAGPGAQPRLPASRPPT